MGGSEGEPLLITSRLSDGPGDSHLAWAAGSSGPAPALRRADTCQSLLLQHPPSCPGALGHLAQVLASGPGLSNRHLFTAAPSHVRVGAAPWYENLLRKGQ